LSVHAYSRRTFRRPPYRGLLILIVIAIMVVARFFSESPPAPDLGRPLDAGTYRVQRVVDGDTIIFAPDTTVRLIGVDTPETVRPDYPVEPFGPEASAFTTRFLQAGSGRLAFDRERTDQYGRHLAYVWVDGRMLNEELVRAGLARYESQFRYDTRIKSRFREAQQAAQREHLGLWSEGTGR
jgi:micrococcal nuclease